ncbi:protein trichome birefringence-like 25 [Prosopis cineraria]|uniref:protein trichome birefringence-like 25 n=1 Tax=Prosopis cineraria TaxID=364024 RepID=UPI00240EDFB7|nr:protein trichome birefringence-like 25 [Prosopis cineraria]
MMKEMRSAWNPFFLQKHKNQALLKCLLSFFLVGLALRLLFSDSFSLLSVVQTPPAPKNDKSESPVLFPPPQVLDSVDFPGNQNQTSLKVSEKCDLFVGDWVPDPSGPLYTNESCNVIEDHQNCMRNGRPDKGYLYWRWSPRDCELPKFNPPKFLHLMRDKSLAFIGDSISRNHAQSLLCILSQVEPALEIYHDEEYRSKIWKFPTHNFTLSLIWTPFLIKSAIFEDINGVSSSEIQLYLDHLDNKWTSKYEDFDYVVIAGGKWFLKTAIYHENDTVTGCHYCPGKNLTELGFDYAYRKALRLVFDFIKNSSHSAMVFFRTTTPDHFENGEWFSGGYCNRTVPFKQNQIDPSDADSTMRDIELEEFQNTASQGLNHGATLKLLDTTFLSLLRPDGHPGPYRQYQPFARDGNAEVQNDCLHWCSPGPIDSWNELLMEMLVNDG